jgi:hypothetical protein
MDDWYNRERLRHEGFFDDFDANASRRKKIKEQINIDEGVDTVRHVSYRWDTQENKGDKTDEKESLPKDRQ